MRVFVRNTSLDGKPLESDGQIFTGERPIDVVTAMKGAALFSDHRTLPEYIDMLLRNAKVLVGLELKVQGKAPEELAESLLATLVEHGLADILDEQPIQPTAPEPVQIPGHVYEVLEAIRRSGVTNMIEGPVVIEIARQLGFPEVAQWIDEKKRTYAECIFRGCRPDQGRTL
jgi:hypothetical protein